MFLISESLLLLFILRWERRWASLKDSASRKSCGWLLLRIHILRTILSPKYKRSDSSLCKNIAHKQAGRPFTPENTANPQSADDRNWYMWSRAGAGVGGSDPGRGELRRDSCALRNARILSNGVRLPRDRGHFHGQSNQPDQRQPPGSVPPNVHPRSTRRAGTRREDGSKGSDWRTRTTWTCWSPRGKRRTWFSGSTWSTRGKWANWCHQRCHLQHCPKDSVLCRTKEAAWRIWSAEIRRRSHKSWQPLWPLHREIHLLNTGDLLLCLPCADERWGWNQHVGWPL